MLFEDVIVSLSLGSDTTMVFEQEDHKIPINLKRRELLVLSGEARLKWKHSIPARKKDDGVPRNLRLSMTWRTVKENSNSMK